MRKTQILKEVRQGFYEMAYEIAIGVGLDDNTADAVGQTVAARVMDEKLVGKAIQRAINDEIQKHSQV